MNKTERYGIENQRVRNVEAFVVSCEQYSYDTGAGRSCEAEFLVDGHRLLYTGTSGILSEYVGKKVMISFTPGEHYVYDNTTTTLASRIALSKQNKGVNGMKYTHDEAMQRLKKVVADAKKVASAMLVLYSDDDIFDALAVGQLEPEEITETFREAMAQFEEAVDSVHALEESLESYTER